jgi:phosphatidylethanolamine-binding protein (PEBP) family uncharacterized protein
VRDGLNDWGRLGKGGPSPLIGRHRYFFELYALDVQHAPLHQLTRAPLDFFRH